MILPEHSCEPLESSRSTAMFMAGPDHADYLVNDSLPNSGGLKLFTRSLKRSLASPSEDTAHQLCSGTDLRSKYPGACPYALRPHV